MDSWHPATIKAASFSVTSFSASHILQTRVAAEVEWGDSDTQCASERQPESQEAHPGLSSGWSLAPHGPCICIFNLKLADSSYITLAGLT